MDVDNKKYNTKYLRAKKRVEQIRGYYSHLTVYIVINSFISIRSIISDMGDGATFVEALVDSRHSLWFWWGIGIFFHTYNTFGRQLFFSKDWEERKIKEYMDE